MPETNVMSATLIDSVRSVFTVETLSKIAVLLGESESNVQRAVHGTIPLVLIDILRKSHYPESTTKVWELSRQATTGDFFGEMHELSTGAGGLVPGSILYQKGTDYAKSLLGPRFEPVIAEVGRYAGISHPSAGFITGLVSFASLDAIGRHISMYNADSGALALWLRTQAESIRPATPSGLQVRTALALQHYPWDAPAKRPRSRNNALYVVILLIVVVGAGLFFLYQYRRDHPNFIPNPTDTLAPANTTPRDTVPGSPAR